MRFSDLGFTDYESTLQADVVSNKISGEDLSCKENGFCFRERNVK
jgi:hypothetical protein